MHALATCHPLHGCASWDWHTCFKWLLLPQIEWAGDAHAALHLLLAASACTLLLLPHTPVPLNWHHLCPLQARVTPSLTPILPYAPSACVYSFGQDQRAGACVPGHAAAELRAGDGGAEADLVSDDLGCC